MWVGDRCHSPVRSPLQHKVVFGEVIREGINEHLYVGGSMCHTDVIYTTDDADSRHDPRRGDHLEYVVHMWWPEPLTLKYVLDEIAPLLDQGKVVGNVAGIDNAVVFHPLAI